MVGLMMNVLWLSRYVEQSNLLLEKRNDSLKSSSEQNQARLLQAEQDKVSPDTYRHPHCDSYTVSVYLCISPWFPVSNPALRSVCSTVACCFALWCCSGQTLALTALSSQHALPQDLGSGQVSPLSLCHATRPGSNGAWEETVYSIIKLIFCSKKQVGSDVHSEASDQIQISQLCARLWFDPDLTTAPGLTV